MFQQFRFSIRGWGITFVTMLMLFIPALFTLVAGLLEPLEVWAVQWYKSRMYRLNLDKAWARFPKASRPLGRVTYIRD